MSGEGFCEEDKETTINKSTKQQTNKKEQSCEAGSGCMATVAAKKEINNKTTNQN